MQQTLEKVCLNINLIRFDQRYYIKSYCTSNVLPLPLLPYLRLHRDSDVAELQCNVLIKKNNSCTGWIAFAQCSKTRWISQHLSREIANGG